MTKNQSRSDCRINWNPWATTWCPSSTTASARSRCVDGRCRTPCSWTSRCRDWTASRRSRQIAVDPGTPVIILTAHGHPNLIDQAVEDGVISYPLKPATNPSLHAAVQVAVARARELKALQEDVDELKSTLRERQVDRAGQGHPDVPPASQRERGVQQDLEPNEAGQNHSPNASLSLRCRRDIRMPLWRLDQLALPQGATRAR